MKLPNQRISPTGKCYPQVTPQATAQATAEDEPRKIAALRSIALNQEVELKFKSSWD